jgi:hypothetical protein
MRSVTVVAISACALFTVAGRLTAQQPQVSKRTSYTFGVSKGSGALTCTFCSGEGKGGIAGMFGIETPLRRTMRMGIEADWWMHSGDGSSRSVLAAIPVIHFYKSPNSPLFFKVGLGLGRYSASSETEELRTTALSGVVGAGYEFRLSNRNVLIPYVSWVSGAGGDMRLNGALVTPQGGLSLVQYGLAFSKR